MEVTLPLLLEALVYITVSMQHIPGEAPNRGVHAAARCTAVYNRKVPARPVSKGRGRLVPAYTTIFCSAIQF